nr:adenine nucleotide transporter BT1, chloroplastic/mitochondrial-like [Ipomoea batatas]
MQTLKNALLRMGLFGQYKLPEMGFKESGLPELVSGEVGNPSLRRLISGAIAGVILRTAVAPLETIRTHLMVGNYGHSTTEVFQNIMQNEVWKGLFRGNLVNVIRVLLSKAIEESKVKTSGESKSGKLPKAPSKPKSVKLSNPKHAMVAGSKKGKDGKDISSSSVISNGTSTSRAKQPSAPIEKRSAEGQDGMAAVAASAEEHGLRDGGNRRGNAKRWSPQICGGDEEMLREFVGK